MANENPNRIADIEIKSCVQCAEKIAKKAKLCKHCSNYQNWRRHLNFSNAFLALLIALIAVGDRFTENIQGVLSPKPDGIDISQPIVKGLNLHFTVTNRTGHPARITSVGGWYYTGFHNGKRPRITDEKYLYLLPGTQEVVVNAFMLALLKDRHKILHQEIKSFPQSVTFWIRTTDGELSYTTVESDDVTETTLFENHFSRCRKGLPDTAQSICKDAAYFEGG